MSRIELPEQPPPSAVRYLVLGWFCLLASLAYVHRGCVAVPTGDIMTDLDIDKDTLAQVMSAFFLGYTIFQLPSGWAGDRLGTRLVLSLCILAWSAATGWMALTSTAMGMWLARLVNGVAQAGIFPCCVKSISRWFPEAEKAFPNGMLGSFMSVGAVIATALTGVLLWYMDWREAFLWLSLPGLVIAAGFFWWFRDDPAQHPQVNAKELALIRAGKHEAETAHAAAGSVWPILLGGPMLLVYTQQFCRAAGYIFYLTWFPTFLQQTRGVSVPDSGLWASVPLLGVVLGCASGGYLLDLIYRLTASKQLSRQGVALGSLVACGLLICAAYFATDALGTVLLLAVGSFCAGLAAPAAYTITIDLGGRHVATVFSTMNMMGNFGAFLMPMVVAELVDWYSWNEALLLLAGLYLTAACCWVMVRVESPPAPPADSGPGTQSENIQVLHSTPTAIQRAERPPENIKKRE